MRKKKTEDTFLFKLLEDAFITNGLWEITPEVLEKIWKAGQLEPPEVERVVDVKDRVSFIGNVNGYALTINTPYNRKNQSFSKHGCMNIVIAKLKDKGEKSLLFRFIYRRVDSSHIGKTIQYVEYILEELRDHWPLTKKNLWAELKEFKGEKFFWVDESGKKIRDFFGNTQAYPLVAEGEKQRRYYHKVTRLKQGIKRYRRNIRKLYSKRKS